ncbi:MAG TPA: ABC transporter ATP-binding protein [Fimbriimonas sp.]|nr:ABC transporter ATP-binding protein [Fimbriimonas sp.]
MLSSPRSTGTHDEDLKRRLSLSSVWRVVRLAVPYRKVLAAAGLLTLTSTLLNLALPLLVRVAVDKITTTSQVHYVDLYGGILAGVLLIGAILGYLQFVISAYAGNKIIKELRERLFAHLQRLPVTYFDRTRSGDIGSHLSNDVSQLQVTLASDVSGFVGNVVMVGGGLLIAIYLNWRLSAIAFSVLVVVMAFFVFTGRTLRKTNRAALDALADAMGSITEAVANIRLVKAFARERYEDERVSEKLGDVFRLSLKASKLEGLMMTAGISGSFFMLIGCMWYGGRGVLNGSFTAGQMAGFVFVIFLILPSMAQLAALMTRLQRAVGASERLFAILDQPQEPDDPADAIGFPEGSCSVRYDSVEFSYVPDAPVLVGLCLEIPAGKVTALVGPSGSGKTTLASLFYRFYEPQAGVISVNGEPIDRIRRLALRENVGIVPQDPILFNGTIRENIRYGRLDASDAEIEQAARDANVEEFVAGFPHGYETQIGERGITLSGGQRQRVAIARALLKDPRILILDEATSALDNRSEALIREALDRLMEGRTTMVIAHRLSTVRSADQIAVVAEGRILETGTHAELLGKGGTYAELYEIVEA